MSQLRSIGIDDETELFQVGSLTPPLVCTSMAERDTVGNIQTELYTNTEGIAYYIRVLNDQNILSVIHNAPFDLAVVCNEHPELIFFVFDAFLEGRIACTIVIQKLIDIALGMRKYRRIDGKNIKTKYTLADLMLLYYNEVIEKEDTWRLSYALLKNYPLDQWPASAKEYAIKDAVYHLRVWEAQQRLIQSTFGGNLPNQIEQQRANFVLHLMSIWGIRAEKSRVDYFIKHCEEEILKMHQALLYCLHCGKPRKDHSVLECAKFENTGIFREERNGKIVRTMTEIKRRVVESFTRQGMKVPYTEKGNVITDKDTLELCLDDPHLAVLAEQMTFSKHLSQWGPVLRAAQDRPVISRYEVMVETGRTSCGGSEGQEGSNWQNPPRKGDVRPAVIPRPGNAFCFTDADTIELRAQAQDCLEMIGWSRMADALIDQHQNGGPDLHERLAANLVGISAQDLQTRRKQGDVEMAEARQFGKVPGFGLWGGLGSETLVGYAAAQLSREVFKKWFGTTRDEQIRKATWIREVWFETWPEARYYFQVVGKMIDRKKGYGTIQQLMSGRIRGQVRFTAAANGFFQARVADAEKEILWCLGYEMYTGRCSTCWSKGCAECNDTGRSILFGSRTVLFLHDEPGVEHELETASERAERQRQIVERVLNKWMPNIPCTSTAILGLRWFKGAESVFICECGKHNGKKKCECGKLGKLVPSKPVKVNDKIKWVHDDGKELTLTAA